MYTHAQRIIILKRQQLESKRKNTILYFFPSFVTRDTLKTGSCILLAETALELIPLPLPTGLSEILYSFSHLHKKSVES